MNFEGVLVMNNSFSITFPYPIGTFLIKCENNQNHVDQIYKYVVRKNGISVILFLDALTKPVVSREISIEELEANWVVYDKQYMNNVAYRRKLK